MSSEIEANIDIQVEIPEVNICGSGNLDVGSDIEFEAKVQSKKECQSPDVEREIGDGCDANLDIGGGVNFEIKGKECTSSSSSNESQAEMQIGGNLDMEVNLQAPIVEIDVEEGGEMQGSLAGDALCCWTIWATVCTTCWLASTGVAIWSWWTPVSQAVDGSSTDKIASAINWNQWVLGIGLPCLWLIAMAVTCACCCKIKKCANSLHLDYGAEVGGDAVHLDNGAELSGDINVELTPVDLEVEYGIEVTGNFDLGGQIELEIDVPVTEVQVQGGFEVEGELEVEIDGEVGGEVEIEVDAGVDAQIEVEVEAQVVEE